MSSKGLAAAGLATLLNVWSSAAAESTPPLGNAASFAVLGKTVDNRGATTITGNLGGTVTNPPTFIAGGVRNDLAPLARADATAAYNALNAGECKLLPAGNVVPPGTYCISSIAGTLTLSGDGPWIFRATTLTAAPGTVVRMAGGGREAHVFWRAADSATLGASTAFAGNLLVNGNITFGSGATLSGRAISLGGTIALDGNKLSLCCEPLTISPASLPAGATGKPYSVPFSASGGLEPYTFQITGSINGLTQSGNVLAGTPTTAGTYPITVTVTDAAGCTASRDYTIEIECSTIVVLPSASPPTVDVPYDLPRGSVGVPYAVTFFGECATPATCGLSAGALPPGLTLTGCVLTGTPSQSGTFVFTMMVSDDAHPAGHQIYKIVVCGPQLPETLPNGCVGVPYSMTVAGAVFSGTIPPGLTSVNGTLSGTPTQAGCFDVTVTVTDSAGCSASRTYRICICPPLTLNPIQPPRPACLNASYDAMITATGGVGPYEFTTPLQPSPFFLFSNGAIKGTPTTAGCVEFIVTVTDALKNSASAPYKICVSSAIDVIPAAIPPATPGVFYYQKFDGTGGTPGYTLTHSGTIPLGLTFVGGVLSGVPKAGGVGALMIPDATFTVTATDANGCSGSRTYSLSLSCSSVAISPPALPAGNVGAPYAQMFAATGGAPPYNFTLVSGSLPPGLTLGGDGAIGGTPTATGTYCFTVAAADAGGCGTGQVAYAIVINGATCPAGTTITLSPPGLPFAPTGAPYAQPITAAGGTPPYTFAVTAGTLPPGLTLNPVTGLLAGTPTSGGRYIFTITATDANGCVGSMGCSAALAVDIPALSLWAIAGLAFIVATVGVGALRRSG